MGSVGRRIRSRGTRELRRSTAALVKRAVTAVTYSRDCINSGDERFAEMTVDGWKLRLACRMHLEDETTALPLRTSPTGGPDDDLQRFEHWHLVMQLHPYGRPERRDDWSTLAEVVARIAEHTGYVGPYLDALTSIDAQPHAPHHFVWHADGTEIDAAHRRAIARNIVITAPIT